MGEFMSFRRFITPAVIQVLFWIGVVVVIISSLLLMSRGGALAILGLLYFVMGVILVRVYCELLILFFRMYDALHGIEGSLKAPWPPVQPLSVGGLMSQAPTAPAPAPPAIPPSAPPATS